MALAPRPALRRPAAVARTQYYEDFDPTTEWKEEAEANFLLLYLPHFIKEQIRISVELSREIRVFGQRPIITDHNKWSRFNKSFTIPENCDVDKIVGRFQDGVLTITLPKVKITPSPIPSEPASTSNIDKEENEKKTLMQQQLEEQRKQNLWETYVNHDENCLGWDELRKAMDDRGSSIPGLMAYLGIFHADSNGDGKVELDELDELVQFMENSPFSIEEKSK